MPGAAFNVTAVDFACSREKVEVEDFMDLFTASNGKVEVELDKVKSHWGHSRMATHGLVEDTKGVKA